jgi:hypothetical protein
MAVGRLYFGYGQNELLLRLDPAPDGTRWRNINWNLRVVFSTGHEATVNLGELAEAVAGMTVKGPPGSPQTSSGAKVARGQVLELSIPWQELALGVGDSVGFYVEIHRGGELLQRLPARSAINIKVPDKDFGQHDWSA